MRSAFLFACLLFALPVGARAQVDQCVAQHEQVQLSRRAGALIAARDASLRCAQRTCPQIVRSDCTTWHAELMASLPSLVIALEGGAQGDVTDAKIFLDGKLLAERVDGKPVELDPGAYTLRVEAAGYAPVEQKLVMRSGERGRIVRLTLAPIETVAPAPVSVAPIAVVQDTAPPQHRGAKIAAITLGAVGVASLAAYAGFGLVGKGKEDDLRDSKCAPSCSQSDVDDVKRDYRLANTFAGIAGASAAAALITYFVGTRRGSDQQARVQVDSFGAGVKVHGAF